MCNQQGFVEWKGQILFSFTVISGGCSKYVETHDQLDSWLKTNFKPDIFSVAGVRYVRNTLVTAKDNNITT
jgi:hypothetical protein